jgi:hypothetical protein
MTTTELNAPTSPVPAITVNSVTLIRAFQNGSPRSMPYARFSAERIACSPDEAVHSVASTPTVNSARLR